ncbi:hypothetical protein FSPOR_5163 [Fusarium sporotrichioides]|uniref:Metallo-beta-lactamase domain-containing protein n=1 Tax=Fusarium sporotrichioides TaxID=5514 RepID=A0A395S8G9_FUSSP|nr:hypothetical protein FSPOR_5163 [Fusarium sporotrichioides]
MHEAVCFAARLGIRCMAWNLGYFSEQQAVNLDLEVQYPACSFVSAQNKYKAPSCNLLEPNLHTLSLCTETQIFQTISIMENANKQVDWRVANYQIPVPIGDCSAYFLINNNDNKVEKAFLMDGGTNAGGYFAWVQILKGLRHIDLELGTDWKFDSWVVTHWDEDHHRGVRDLLSSGLKLFRFVQNGDKEPTARTPSSTFAENYFCEQPWLLCGALDHVMFFNKKNKLDIDFLKPFIENPELPVPGNFGTFFDDAHEIMRSRAASGVGIDLFTRTRQFNLNGTVCSETSDRFSDWGIQNDPKSLQPRFCVIGADGYGIGNGARIVSEPTRNETSILAILYWPENRHCSYYTGGDGNPSVAKDIVNQWLSRPDRFDWHGQVDLMKLDHHGSTKENLGSKNKTEVGTPVLANAPDEAKKKATDIITDILIEKLKPQGLLVTPGTQHGHPTPEDHGSENLQAVYQKIHDSYRAGNQCEDKDDEVTLYDLIVLDQKARVDIQTEFEKEKNYGNRLKKMPGTDILKNNGQINWGKVQELLTEKCQSLLKLKPDGLEKALNESSNGVDSRLFWAWHSWAWHVEDSLLDGAVQYSDICWQPIVSDGNPHFLISFSFGNHGKDRSIEVFNDDGEYQLINDGGSVSRVPTNLFVKDTAAKWTELVYSPLTLATIFDLKDFDNQTMVKNAPIFRQALSGNMRQMNLAIDVLFNTKPVDPKPSSPSARKVNKSAKLRVAKLDETIANYKVMSFVGQPIMDEKSKKAVNRTSRTRRSKTFERLQPTEKEELIDKNHKALLNLAYGSYTDINEVLLHDQICYFAWHHMSKEPYMRKIISEVWKNQYDGGVQYDDIQEDAMLRTVDFLLSNFKIEDTFK